MLRSPRLLFSDGQSLTFWDAQARPGHFLRSRNQPFLPAALVLYWKKVSSTESCALVGSFPWGVEALRYFHRER